MADETPQEPTPSAKMKHIWEPASEGALIERTTSVTLNLSSGPVTIPEEEARAVYQVLRKWYGRSPRSEA